MSLIKKPMFNLNIGFCFMVVLNILKASLFTRASSASCISH
ncbi:hypothetical protein PPAR_a2866 [Pseudoalteromonas paragorgicola KMM 3548]|nr:hypothetical protein [Pseudoalteromonas distincta KMM 3548]